MDFSSKKVLVVDDMASMRQLAVSCLNNMGITQVVEAANGQIALKALNSGRFNLIICDWDMPVMTGLELLKAVRADAWLSDIKFIMLTANARVGQVMEAKEAGIDDYVAKPLKPSVLQAKVQRQLLAAG
jgi:two-component system chemotaxis response regulator CheY